MAADNLLHESAHSNGCSLAASRKRVNWVLDADIRDLRFVTSTVRNERFPSIALNVLHNRVETILTPRSQNDH